MKLATVRLNGRELFVICFDGHVADVARLWRHANSRERGLELDSLGVPDEPPPDSMRSYLAGGRDAYDTTRRYHDLVTGIWERRQRTALSGIAFKEDEVEFLCPHPRPPMLFHIGENYPRYYRQQPLGSAIPAVPAYDVVPTHIAVGHRTPLVIPKASEEYGGHGEIGCIIGTGGRDIAIADARDHIAGYLCVLDFHSGAAGFTDLDAATLPRAQALTFAQLVRMRTASQPMGPYLTTIDEVGDPYDCMVHMKINDEVVARYWSNVIIHGFERTISHLSHFMTLLPGTIIQLGMMSSYSIGFSKDDIVPPDLEFSVDIERVGHLKVKILREGVDS